MSEEKLRELAKGFRDRTWVTAKLATRVGVKWAKRNFGAKDEAPIDAADAVRSAEQMVAELGKLKGLVMKVGQMASYLPGALPQEAQDVLARLQASSTAMEYDAVAEVVREELGAEPDALFDELAREPFAAASIGQVHRAVFRGRPVAVKIQYPGVNTLLQKDLDTIGAMVKLSTFGLPMDGGALVDELRERMAEECDYVKEAENTRFFAALLSHYPDCHVPEVLSERTSRRVLTTELVDAMRFQEFAEKAGKAERDRAAAIIFRTCMNSIFRHSVYNGDPHPGNYLFHPDGRVTFLDFGCVRRFNRELIETWKSVALSVLDGDRARFQKRYVDLGFVPNPKKFDWEHQWAMMSYLYKPFTQRNPFFSYTDDYVRESYGLMLFDNPNKYRTAMPPAWLLLNRLQWGLNSILSRLEATGPWPNLFRAAVESPTASA